MGELEEVTAALVADERAKQLAGGSRRPPAGAPSTTRRATPGYPDIDARRIVERASGREGAGFHLALDEPVPARAVSFFESMVIRRGEPFAVCRRCPGFCLDLLVDTTCKHSRPLKQRNGRR